MGQATSTPRAAPAADRPPPDGYRCVVAAGTRLTTRTGVPTIESFADSEVVEVWSSIGWVKARVVHLASAPVVRVRLSDGSHLDCCATTCWPIIPPGDPDEKGSQPDGASSGRAERYTSAPNGPTKSDSLPKADSPTKRSSPPNADSPTKRSSPVKGDSPPRSLNVSVGGNSGNPKYRLKTAWTPKETTNIWSGDRITPFPFPPPPFADLVGSAVTPEEAYAAGLALGSKVSAHKAVHRHGLDDAICGSGATPGYSGAAVRAFIDGWAVAQQGCLLGCEYVVADLQILTCRTGVAKTLTERGLLRANLVLDDRGLWEPTVPADAAAPPPRKWARRLRTTHQTVLDVESLGEKRSMYALIVEANAPVAVFVDNTMIGTSGRAAEWRRTASGWRRAWGSTRSTRRWR